MATVPENVVSALMTMTPESNAGGLHIARFTEDARDDILAKFPGATYKTGADSEQFIYEGHEAAVMIDYDALEEKVKDVDWERATPDQLKRGVIVEVTKVGDAFRRNKKMEKEIVDALKALAESLPQAHSAPAAGGRRKRKTRRGKQRSRRVRR